MKKVLILGDSIQMYYQQYVKEYIGEEVELFFDPTDNGRFTNYTYWQLNQFYRLHGNFDIVHFNNGYWDMNVEAPMTTNLNEIPDYVRGLEKIVQYVQSKGGKVIFATTCPIFKSGQMFDNTGVNSLFLVDNQVVINYNNAAKELMKKYNVEINDLYETLLKGPNYYKCDDWLHLNDEGCRICGKQVAEIIKKNI